MPRFMRGNNKGFCKELEKGGLNRELRRPGTTMITSDPHGDRMNDPDFVPVSMKDAVCTLISFRRASSNMAVYINGDNQAILPWCALTRGKNGVLIIHIDARCPKDLIPEFGLMLDQFRELQFSPHPIWIEGNDFLLGKAALKKHREYLDAIIATSDTPESPEGSSP